MPCIGEGGTKNKYNSYRNKNNTIHYGPGWGSLLPPQFLFWVGTSARVYLANMFTLNVTIYIVK